MKATLNTRKIEINSLLTWVLLGLYLFGVVFVLIDANMPKSDHDFLLPIAIVQTIMIFFLPAVIIINIVYLVKRKSTIAIVNTVLSVIACSWIIFYLYTIAQHAPQF